VDFIAKPAAGGSFAEAARELSIKVKAAAGVRPTALAQPAEPEPTTSSTKLGSQLFRQGDPLVVTGASTGRPRAAVAVVQHMPAAFTPTLAQRLNQMSPLVVQEAANGDRLARGLALLAPGDFHMRFEGFRKISLDQGPPCDFVRPAIDVTMESAARHHGRKVIGVALTGSPYQNFDRLDLHPFATEVDPASDPRDISGFDPLPPVALVQDIHPLGQNAHSAGCSNPRCWRLVH
jgi:two-component system chemotaxis response regulator CheB